MGRGLVAAAAWYLRAVAIEKPDSGPREETIDRAPDPVALRDARERVIARLSDGFAHDELELEEFEQRLGLAHRSSSLAELSQLTRDLAVSATALAKVPAVAPAPVPASVRAEQTLAAVLGGTTRVGRWTPPRRLRVIAIMGGVELDFREATLHPGVTEVVITAVMGGVSITVPPQLAVEMDGMAIMGGFAHSERAPAQHDPDRPVLRVRGVAVMGGVDIKTRLVGESALEARLRRRALGGRRRALAAGRRAALPPHEE